MNDTERQELIELKQIVASVRHLLQEAEGLVKSGQDRAAGMRMANECKKILSYVFELEKRLELSFKIKREAESLLKHAEEVFKRA